MPLLPTCVYLTTTDRDSEVNRRAPDIRSKKKAKHLSARVYTDLQLNLKKGKFFIAHILSTCEGSGRLCDCFTNRKEDSTDKSRKRESSRGSAAKSGKCTK